MLYVGRLHNGTNQSRNLCVGRLQTRRHTGPEFDKIRDKISYLVFLSDQSYTQEGTTGMRGFRFICGNATDGQVSAPIQYHMDISSATEIVWRRAL